MAVKPKAAPLEAATASGREMIVAAGEAVSIVQAALAAAPVLPAGSVAWTSKVWLPSVRPA